MTSTNFMSGLGEGSKTASKVLRPPGGGTSDIFGSEAGTPARSARNHMASNIFGSSTNTAVKNSGDNIRRGQKNVDSYSRLFGEPERPFTPAKNHMKSNIPIGSTGPGSNKPTTNGSQAPQVNGHEKNGKAENGDQQNNGVTKPEKFSEDESQENVPQEIPLNNADGVQASSNKSSPRDSPLNGVAEKRPDISKTNGTTEISNGNYTNDIKSDFSSSSPTKFTDVNENLKPVEINGNISESTTTTSSSAVSPARSVASSNMSHNTNSNCTGRSSRASARNPVTGIGIDVPDNKPRRMARRRDGNPVTGEGYKAGAEINTTIPCLNGANQVINKNRIPPGGFSSGLW